MSNVLIEFQEDTQTAFCLYVAYHDGDFLCVQYISKGDLVEYRLSLSHVQAIKSISSLDELLAYARANNNIKSYSKNYNQDTSLREETLCPCPPETSDTALSSTDDVDGGILVITKRLKEIKEEINLLNGTAFQNATLTDAQHYQLLDVEMFIDDFIAPYFSLPSETVVGTSEIPLPDCSVCHEPVDIDQFNHNGGACNFCYHELSNDSYDKAIDLERRLL